MPDRAVQAHNCRVLVEFNDDPLDTLQIAGADVMVDLHTVTDGEHRERFVRGDRVQELIAGADRVADRYQVLVKRSGGDLVEQEPLRHERFSRRRGHRLGRDRL